MPMHHFISAIPFLFLFYVPTATASLNDKDDAFLAFVKDEPNFEAFCKELEGKNKLKIDILSNDYHNKKLDFNQKKDYLIQMFEARLGLMYLMRENWKCAEIRKEIKQEKKECEKLGKYLDILYGYLFRVYAAGTGAAADQIVKPMFILRNKVGTKLNEKVETQFIEKVGTLIDILEKLSELSRFFFVPDTTKDHAELMLSNEAKLNALNVANLNGTLREQFDQKLKQMLANTKQNEATEGAAFERLKFNLGREGSVHSYGKHYMVGKNSEHEAKFKIILNSPFYNTVSITPVEEDVLFLAFVKDQSNFGQFCQEKGKDLQYIDYGPTYGFTFDQKKEHLVQKYEANLGVLYLMKKYWICENIGKKIKKEKKECEKFSKYLNILYEYLFRVYLEAANQTLSKQLPAVKPQFEFYLKPKELPLKTLTQIVQGLNEISKFFFDQDFSSSFEYKLNKCFSFVKNTKLSNAEELNYELNADNPLPGGTFREKFDKMLKNMWMNTKKNEAKEEAELKSVGDKIDKMLTKFKKNEKDISILPNEEKDNTLWENFKKRLPAMDEQMKQIYKQMANIDKFGIFLNSPFYDKVDQ